MQFRSLLVLCFPLLAIVPSSWAQTVLISDDFSDPQASSSLPPTDPQSIWSFISPWPGNFEVVPGEGLMVTPTESTSPFLGQRLAILGTPQITPEDFSIRTTVRLQRLEAGGIGAIGIMGRFGPDRSPPDFSGIDGYAADIDVSGALALLAVGLDQESVVRTSLDPSNEDISLRFDLIGDDLSMWAWPADEAMPINPSVTLEDSFFESGYFGLYVAGGTIGGPNEFAGAFFRNLDVIAIPEPSACSVCMTGLLALLVATRRKRNPFSG